MTNFKRICLMSVAACGLMTTTAMAQSKDNYSRDKYQAVTDRYQPDFDPEPVRLGAFVVNSSLQAGVTATDNALASVDNEESDVILRVGARALARTDWSNHEISADVSAFRNEYLDLSDESSNDLRASLAGRVDATRDLSFTGQVFAEDRAEPRTSLAYSTDVDRPVRYTRKGARAGVNYQNDRVRWTNDAGIADYDFKNGRIYDPVNDVYSTFNQDFRDRRVTDARTRLSYAITPDVAVYGQATAHESDYDNDRIVNGATRTRDSKGYTVAAGVDFELTTLVRGDIAVGYLSEDKKDNFYKDVDGLSLDGKLQWFPSRLTTVSFDAGRRIVDIGIPDAPSAVLTSFGAKIDHELRRNIILSAFGDVSDYSYEEIDQTDKVYDLGVSSTYKMSKRVHFEAFARHINRDTSGSAVLVDRDYGINNIGVGVKIFP